MSEYPSSPIDGKLYFASGNGILDLRSKQIFFKDELLELGSKPYGLLSALVISQGEPISVRTLATKSEPVAKLFTQDVIRRVNLHLCVARQALQDVYPGAGDIESGVIQPCLNRGWAALMEWPPVEDLSTGWDEPLT